MQEQTITRAAAVLAARDKSRSYEDHERTARDVLTAVEGDLVLRCLYDSVVRELQRMREGVAAS